MDLKLGIFCPDPYVNGPLAAREGVHLKPEPPFVNPHKRFIKVMKIFRLETIFKYSRNVFFLIISVFNRTYRYCK